ncbi:MAG TPA: hypothetical protein VH394_30330, partial [Thermoanaerobaculia bacterium]|nr:hypothetical protein [Thermoanaerobaculia bacterium]
QPASAQQTRRADLKPAQPVELSVFLASLSGKPIMASSEQPKPKPNYYCPSNFCYLLRQECAADCAPCGSVVACYAYVCDGLCSCSC